MATTSTTSPPSPWHTAYPAPRNTPATIHREDVLEMIKQSVKTSRRDYVLVDLRRNDYEGGTIRDSINLPAQSLYPTIPILYRLFKDAGLHNVIWYCSSSKGRGNRAAGWFADYIADQGDDKMKSLALAEGVKGWATAGDEYIQWMVEYDAKKRATWVRAAMSTVGSMITLQIKKMHGLIPFEGIKGWAEAGTAYV